MNLELEGKVALVTGAGRHIGKEIALRLAREGAWVAVNDYFEDRAEEVARGIREMGGKALGVRADVAAAEDVRKMVDEVLREWGRVDILVNNAGVAPAEAGFPQTGKTFLDMEWGEWLPTISINLLGTIHCTKAVLPTMVEKKYGKIINIMSDAGRIGEPRMVPYSAAKAGIGGFTKALAKEVGPYGINVNAVSLGATPGPHQEARYSPEEWERRKQALLRLYPLAPALNRLGTPQDAAEAVLFLASDRARWITGQIISVNGGYCTVG